MDSNQLNESSTNPIPETQEQKVSLNKPADAANFYQDNTTSFQQQTPVQRMPNTGMPGQGMTPPPVYQNPNGMNPNVPPPVYYQPYGMQPATPTSSVVGMVLGIVSILCLSGMGMGLFLAVPGLICSIRGNAKTKTDIGTVGIVVSTIGIVLNILMCVAFVLMLILGASSRR